MITLEVCKCRNGEWEWQFCAKYFLPRQALEQQERMEYLSGVPSRLIAKMAGSSGSRRAFEA